jgi:maltose O-acetyltransferase
MFENILNTLKNIILELIISWPNSKFGLFLRKHFFNKLFKTNFIHIGRGCEIDRIDSTEFGENVTLGDNVKIIISGMAKCFIGDNVLIADGSYLRSANHKFDVIALNIREQGHTWNKIEYNNSLYGIVIEENVWIGAKSIILSGAHIGKGSVISAGCVISKKIPEFSIVAGNPGKIIGSRIKL